MVEEEEGGGSDDSGKASAESATRDHSVTYQSSVAGPGGHREKTGLLQVGGRKAIQGRDDRQGRVYTGGW